MVCPGALTTFPSGEPMAGAPARATSRRRTKVIKGIDGGIDVLPLKSAAPGAPKVAPEVVQPKKRVQRTKPMRRKKLKELFLRQIEKTGNIQTSCNATGVGRATHQAWFKDDEKYRADFEASYGVYLDAMEREADRRALRGVLRPIYQNGKLVGHERRFSDVLLMFRLNGERAKKYRQRIEHTGEGGGPIEHAVDLSRLSALELRAMRALRMKLDGLEPPSEDLAALRAVAPLPSDGALAPAGVIDAEVVPSLADMAG